MYPFKTALLGFFLASTSGLAFADATLDDAKALIQKGDHQAAYQRLEPQEAARAGELDFDYVFGIAAVESGHASRGAFALERVLALDPNNKDARAEMAKAHFMLGETESSKSEFNQVLAQNPDEQTKNAIQKLLTEIQKIEGTTTTFSAFLEFGLGYDSNVNSAASLNSVSVPALGGLIIQLNKSAKKQSDQFMQLAGGLSVRHPLSEHIAIFGGVSANNRTNYDVSAFDTSSVDFNAGVELKLNLDHKLTLSVQDNHFDLDGEAFRRARGASAQWLYTLSPKTQIGLYAQHSGLTYTGNNIRNADRSIIGANYGHAFEGEMQPVIFASLYGGREDARKDAVDFLTQDIVGARAGGQLKLDPRCDAYVTLGYELRDYHGRDPAFFALRKDQQYDTAFGLNFKPARDWSIRPQLSYSKVDSNIKLNSFDRAILSVTARKDFSW